MTAIAPLDTDSGADRAALILRLVFIGFIWLLGAFVVALIAYPVLTTLVRVFVENGEATLEPLRRLSSVRGIGTIVRNTAIYTIASLLAATVLGAFLAWVAERTDGRIAALSGILPIIPLMVPTIGSALGYVLLFSPRSGVGNIALRWLFGVATPEGPVDILSMAGMIYVSALHLAPMAYLIVAAALRNVDPALDEASRLSGASPLMTLRRVTLPSVRPALAGAALIVGINALGSFIVPFILGTGAGVTTLPVHVFRLFASYPADESQAMTLGICLLVIVYVAVLLQMRVTRSLRKAVVGGRTSQHTMVRLGAWRWPIRALLILYVVCVFLPLLGLVLGAVQPFLGAPPSAYNLNSFRVVLSNSDTRSALVNSLVLAAFTATAAIAISALLIYGATRVVRRGGRLIELAMVTPSTIPSVVLAVSFIIAFSGPPFFLYGTLFLVFLAFVTIYLPEASRASAAALAQAGDELSEASYISGAGLFKTVRRIVLPQVANGLLAGWVIVFFFAVNEVTAAAFLAGINSPVVGRVALEYYANGRMSQVAALTVIVTLATALVVLMTSRIVARAYRLDAKG